MYEYSRLDKNPAHLKCSWVFGCDQEQRAGFSPTQLRECLQQFIPSSCPEVWLAGAALGPGRREVLTGSLRWKPIPCGSESRASALCGPHSHWSLVHSLCSRILALTLIFGVMKCRSLKPLDHQLIGLQNRKSNTEVALHHVLVWKLINTKHSQALWKGSVLSIVKRMWPEALDLCQLELALATLPYCSQMMTVWLRFCQDPHISVPRGSLRVHPGGWVLRKPLRKMGPTRGHCQRHPRKSVHECSQLWHCSVLLTSSCSCVIGNS